MKKIIIGLLFFFLLSIFYSEISYAGDYIISRWKPSSSRCEKAKSAKISIKYVGEGSRLIKNNCFRAIFEDDSTCDGASGDFNDIRIFDNGKNLTRLVCFCKNKYKIKDIIYKCKDNF